MGPSSSQSQASLRPRLRTRGAGRDRKYADPNLKKKFSRLARWQEPRWWFIAFLVYQFLALAITMEYHLDAKWHMKWKAIEAGGQITLTPTK
jgi:hypothetical protein